MVAIDGPRAITCRAIGYVHRQMRRAEAGRSKIWLLSKGRRLAMMLVYEHPSIEEQVKLLCNNITHMVYFPVMLYGTRFCVVDTR